MEKLETKLEKATCQYKKQWRNLRAQALALADGDEETCSQYSIDGQAESDEVEDLQSNQVRFKSDETEGPSASASGFEENDGSGLQGVEEFGFTEYIDSSDSDSDNSDGNDENALNKGPTLHEQLATWANKNKCTRSSLNELLDILRTHGNVLPKDARTLLETPRTVESIEKCGGQYTYFGLEEGIKRISSYCGLVFNNNDIILLNINVDGVPLFKSSNLQLWPILCSFLDFEPFIVALYCGVSKPSSVQGYLGDFLQEYTTLKQQVITYDSKTLKIIIRAFICDSPAGAFLKCIKSHNSYYSCERCLIKGQWKGRLVYHSDDVLPLRTEEDFKTLQYKSHQIQLSPLTSAGIQCIKTFPLDYMHLVCLGVVKRLLCFLKHGPIECKLSSRHISEISSNLLSLNGKMPNKFARQPRSLTELDR